MTAPLHQRRKGPRFGATPDASHQRTQGERVRDSVTRLTMTDLTIVQGLLRNPERDCKRSREAEPGGKEIASTISRKDLKAVW